MVFIGSIKTIFFGIPDLIINFKNRFKRRLFKSIFKICKLAGLFIRKVQINLQRKHAIPFRGKTKRRK